MSIIPAAIILVAGCCLVAMLAKIKWPGWIGVLLVFIVLCVIRDLAATPIAGLFIERYWVNPTEGIAATDEITTASLLVLLNAVAFAAGIVIAIIVKSVLPHKKSYGLKTSYSLHITSRAWKASFLLFLFSTLCQTIVLYYLLREINFLDIATTRALFSAKKATSISLFSYVRLFSSFTPIAVWGMILFAAQKRYRMIMAVFGVISVLLFEVMYGNRLQLAATVVGITVIYHYGVRRIRLRKTFLVAAILLVGLLAIQFVRMKVPDISGGVKNVAVDVLMSDSVNQAAFAIRHFPEDVPFIGIGFISNELSKLFPTIRKYMTWNKNIWDDIVEHIRGGRSGFIGKGGNHYIPAAESYMQYGIRGVVFIGSFIGFFYGLIFLWQRGHPNNTFILMVATYAFVSFVMSFINGKMFSWVSSMGFGALLPIGFLSIATFKIKWEVLTFCFFLFICFMCIAMKRLISYPELFDYAFAATLVFTYLLAIYSIGKKQRFQNDKLRHIQKAL
jgi:oligosaccharide repeat unit polymerase